MALISTECENIENYLTEYSRNQLSSIEQKEISEHLANCTRCRRIHDELKKLSSKIDKIIPVVTNTYEKDFIYRLFVNSKPESAFVKVVSVALIIFLIGFIISSAFQPKADYTSIKALEYRAKSIFNENFYSHGQNK